MRAALSSRARSAASSALRSRRRSASSVYFGSRAGRRGAAGAASSGGPGEQGVDLGVEVAHLCRERDQFAAQHRALGKRPHRIGLRRQSAGIAGAGNRLELLQQRVDLADDRASPRQLPAARLRDLQLHRQFVPRCQRRLVRLLGRGFGGRSGEIALAGPGKHLLHGVLGAADLRRIECRAALAVLGDVAQLDPEHRIGQVAGRRDPGPGRLGLALHEGEFGIVLPRIGEQRLGAGAERLRAGRRGEAKQRREQRRANAISRFEHDASCEGTATRAARAIANTRQRPERPGPAL
jgi:hypothetical protein